MLHPFRRSVSLLGCGLLSLALLAGCGESVDSERQAAIYLESGAAYRQQGQYRAAMIEARNAIKYAPQKLEGYWLLADILAQLGNPHASNEVLMSLEGVEDPRHLKRIATNHVALGKLRSARELLANPALAANLSSDPDLQILQAKILAGEGRLNDALGQLQDLIRRQPDAREAHLTLATLQLQAHHKAAASAALKDWLQRQPDDAEFLALQAAIAAGDNQLELSERLLTQALQTLPQTDLLTPLKARVLRQLAAVLTQLGRSSEALAYSQLLARAAPGADEQRQKLNQALDLYRAGDFQQAEKLLSELYETSPGNQVGALLLGLVQYEQGNYEDASELLGDNVDPETMSAPVIEATALAQLREQRPADALALLREALLDHGDNARLQAIYGMAALQFAEHQESGAIALNKALSLDPERATLRLPLAEYYIRTGRVDQARAQIVSAANQAPADPRIQTAAIQFFLRAGEADTAQTMMGKFLEASPSQASTLVLAARLGLLNKDPASAKSLLARALKAEPGSTEALLTLGQMALQQRDWTTASSHFKTAIDHSPDSVSAYKGLLSAYEVRGSVQAGLDALTALADSNGSAIPRAVIAEFLLRHNRLDDAAAQIRQVQAAATGDNYVGAVTTSVYRAQADAQRQARNLDAARNTLMAAIQLQPDNQDLLSDLVRLELLAGRTEEADKLIAQIRSQPNGAMLAALLAAAVEHTQGHPDKALAVLNARWKAAGEPAVAERLYALLKGMGQDRQALELASAWADQHPRDPRPLTILAMDAQQRGEVLVATRWYERSLTLQPDQPVVLNNLAWLKFEAGDAQAVELAQRASELAPTNASILDTYGWILFKRGNKQAALPILQRAARYAPDSKEIADHLAEAEKG